MGVHPQRHQGLRQHRARCVNVVTLGSRLDRPGSAFWIFLGYLSWQWFSVTPASLQLVQAATSASLGDFDAFIASPIAKAMNPAMGMELDVNPASTWSAPDFRALSHQTHHQLSLVACVASGTVTERHCRNLIYFVSGQDSPRRRHTCSGWRLALKPLLLGMERRAVLLTMCLTPTLGDATRAYIPSVQQDLNGHRTMPFAYLKAPPHAQKN